MFEDSPILLLKSHILVTADGSKPTEGIPQDVDMPYDKASSPLAEETEDEKLKCMDSEIQMQKCDVNKKVDEDDFYATHEEKSIDALEQEKSICDDLQAQVEKEPQEDLRGHQLEDSRSENPCTTEQDVRIHQLVHIKLLGKQQFLPT